MAMRIAVSRASVNWLAASARGATRFFRGGRESIQEMAREREERRKHEADTKAEQGREAARKLNFGLHDIARFFALVAFLCMEWLAAIRNPGGSSKGETKKSGSSEVAGHDSFGDSG